MERSDKILFSRDEAAGMLSISVRSVDYLLARGELRAVRKGRRLLIPRTELERWAKKDNPQPIRRTIAPTAHSEQLRLT
ncbi:MAG TPA: helix-turn-helix domain-containing protein [Candidatus Acidoferrales bacterium]